jgi:hypothetical protein
MFTPRFMTAVFAALLVALTAGSANAQRRPRPEYEPADPARTAPANASNLFLKKTVTASGQWSDRAPTFAVDGKADDPGAHWACENNPTWLMVDMGEAKPLNAVHLTTYWGGNRYYGYRIEGSTDKQTWETLTDRRTNLTPSTPAGDWLTFPERSVRYVRLTITKNSVSDTAGGHIVEVAGYRLDAAAIEEHARWSAHPGIVEYAWVTTDIRYGKHTLPPVPKWGDDRRMSHKVTAWRGERIQAQMLLWSTTGAEQVRVEPWNHEDSLPAQVRFVRYVLADKTLAPDILDDVERMDIPARTVRPVWVSVDVPRDARPGLHSIRLSISAKETGRDSGIGTMGATLHVEVLPATLPAPKDWAFYLDLWQNPYALARYHHVRPFSEAHLAVMRPHLKLLANAGQKVITTTILHAPWGGQTYDSYDSMVEWTRTPDGKWQWDYTNFDRYVEFARSCGIGPYINCYSMIPWTNELRYRDTRTGEYRTLPLQPGEAFYADVWGPFLKDFTRHLAAKGWLKYTRIAMDERPLPAMKAAWDVVKKNAPGLGIALAGEPKTEFKDEVTDWCAYLTPELSREIIAERTKKGLPTTFYVCCVPNRPNTFTNAPPAESTWLGLYAAARGYTGFLRWAFDSWTEDPLYDTKHVTWDAGDCFLVYPGARSSIRFERLREGIQEYEKVRILRQRLAGTPELAQVEEALSRLTLKQAQSGEPVAPLVNAAKAAITEAARKLRQNRAGKKPSRAEG